MKELKHYLGYVCILALLFTSCSKDEQSGINAADSQKATLSFATVLNDMMAKRADSKQSLDDLPSCSDADPAYVEIILSDGSTQVVGTTATPQRIDVNPNPGDYDNDGVDEYFTDESASLELEPGTYSLDYFKVYDAQDNLLWVAPRSEGSYGDLVDNPLPFNINLGAGVKKYVDVDVLCYDQRMVNLYGYLFFDIEETQVINFCIFGNYCDVNGRHFPAHFNVSVWKYADETIGDQLYTGQENSVSIDDNGDYAGTTVCVDLPDTPGVTDEYYFEITLMDSDAYGDVENTVIRSGVITDQQVRDMFTSDTNTDYYHFREGNCGTDDTPDLFNEGGGGSTCDPNDPNADCDNDQILNGVDNCPTTYNPDQADLDGDNIGDVCDPDIDDDNVPNGEDACPDVLPGAGQVDPDHDGCWTEPETGGGLSNCEIGTAATGCFDAYIESSNSFILADVDADQNPDLLLFYLDSVTPGADNDEGTVTATVDSNGDINVQINIGIGSSYVITGYEIEVRPSNGGNVSTTENDSACGEFTAASNTLAVNESLHLNIQDYPFYIRVKLHLCEGTPQ